MMYSFWGALLTLIIRRQTFYRWQRPYRPRHSVSLESRSSRARRVRQPTALTVAWATHSRIKAFGSSSQTAEKRARRTIFLVGVLSALSPFCW